MRKIDDSGEARNKRITLNITPSFDARIRALAKIRGTSVNEFAIRAVTTAMEDTTDEEETAIAALIDAKKKYDRTVDKFTNPQPSLFSYGDSDSAVDGNDTDK